MPEKYTLNSVIALFVVWWINLQAAQLLLLVGEQSAGSRSHMPGSVQLAAALPKLHTQGSVGNAEDW